MRTYQFQTRRIAILIAASLITALLIFFSSCTENPDSVSSGTARSDNLEYSQIHTKGSKAKTDGTGYSWKQGDTYRLQQSILHHFEPINGRELYMAIYENNFTLLRKMKTTWGFSGTLIGLGSISSATSAGFDIPHIIVFVDQIGYHEVIPQAHAAGITKFLTDEVVHRMDNPTILSDINRYIKDNQSEWYLDDYVAGNPFTGWYYYDRMAYYAAGYGLQGIGSDKYWDSRDVTVKDPREHWQYIHTQYGSLFNFTWVNLDNIDQPHFSELLGMANNLGLNRIFVYNSPSNYELNMYAFCGSARANGWLRQYNQYVWGTYVCTNPNGTTGTPLTDPSSWFLLSTEPMNPPQIYPLP